jgi:serine phosphatase RsbU (regulator of sigma subunit)
MLPRCSRFPGLDILILMAAASGLACAAQPPAPSTPGARTLVLDGLGKGTAPLDGPWQFHLGDDPAWAKPGFDDSGWEQLTADKTWGAQTHPSYEGYAWYRKAISVTPAQGASPDVALLIPAIDDIYEIYWNGQLVGQLGAMPPDLLFLPGVPPQTFGLGPARNGVLSIRVFKTPLASNDSDSLGGFEGVPLIGSPQAIDAAKGNMDFHWLRSQQFRFGLTSLYALVALLSFIAWSRDRSQWLLFWMTIFAITPLMDLLIVGMRFAYSGALGQFFTQSQIQLREMAQWFVLMWLLQLHESRGVVRLTRIAAIAVSILGPLDGTLLFFYPSLLNAGQLQIVDAFLTVFLIWSEVIPAVLVAVAIYQRKRLDSARWAVAILAFLNATIYAVENAGSQGVRFTHWTISDKIAAPMFSLFGNPMPILTVIRTLLFLSIVYAVIRYSVAERRRQTSLEQEIQNARELQQVLVPETLPALPGFTLTSAYKPAQEVGGDFFQVIPLEKGPLGDGTSGGSTLVVLGDVSGKGLKAAMAVSMIVGVIRTLAESTSSPAEILTGLNRRLSGRLQGGFATAIALRLDRDGSCTLACAGHPAPFVNDREMTFPGALPLGITPTAVFEETRLKLSERDQLALYTDGLLEARSQSGELYSFDRLKTLFATNPTAEQAAQAAVNFGQDDDITVLTLTRHTAEAA